LVLSNINSNVLNINAPLKTKKMEIHLHIKRSNRLKSKGVAISRVKTKRGLKILILHEDGNVMNTTKNVVYKEFFETLWQRRDYRYVFYYFWFDFNFRLYKHRLTYLSFCFFFNCYLSKHCMFWTGAKSLSKMQGLQGSWCYISCKFVINIHVS